MNALFRVENNTYFFAVDDFDATHQDVLFRVTGFFLQPAIEVDMAPFSYRQFCRIEMVVCDRARIIQACEQSRIDARRGTGNYSKAHDEACALSCRRKCSITISPASAWRAAPHIRG